MQAGHFIHNKLDYDERNIHAQCVHCNKYLSGNLGRYANHLIKDYGVDILDALEVEAARRGNDYSIEELKYIITRYAEVQ